MNLLVEERATVSMVAFSKPGQRGPGAGPSGHHGRLGLAGSHGRARPHAGKPHPRMYGTFPRVLGEYARERKLFSLETAVSKMTGMCAHRLGLRDRGIVKPGAAADLTVFDPRP